jgi:hypothetical protein
MKEKKREEERGNPLYIRKKTMTKRGRSRPRESKKKRRRWRDMIWIMNIKIIYSLPSPCVGDVYQ